MVLIIVIKIFIRYNDPAKIKNIAPTISCFQDINKIIDNINTGILCIKRPIIISFAVAVGVITSNENKAKNNMKIIDNILGVQ